MTEKTDHYTDLKNNAQVKTTPYLKLPINR